MAFLKGRDRQFAHHRGEAAGRASPFVLGDQPTIADISLVGYLYYPAEEFRLRYPGHAIKNIGAWLERIKALPGWAHSPTI